MKTQEGVSLIEVLVASVILTIITYFISQAIIGSYQHERILTVKQEGREFRDDLRSLVTNAKNCGIPEKSVGVLMLADFLWASPVDLNGKSVDQIEGFGTTLRKGSAYGAVTIGEIAVAPFRDRANPSTPPSYFPVDTGLASTANAFRASIRVNYSGHIGASTEVKYFAAEVPVMLRLSSDRVNVSSCSSLDAFDAVEEVCQALGGTMEAEQCVLPPPETGGGGGGDSGRLSVSDPGKTKTPAL